ncbi:hypothetical protein AB0I60_37280 [Actinosynnema sp. NPDC050436]|uniref:hypothetical protein n=1 Tax=Actinosynnema sp. NPDC050436 TaxID=3155659 RepID=UPI0033E8D6D7
MHGPPQEHESEHGSVADRTLTALLREPLRMRLPYEVTDPISPAAPARRTEVAVVLRKLARCGILRYPDAGLFLPTVAPLVFRYRDSHCLHPPADAAPSRHRPRQRIRRGTVQITMNRQHLS